MHLALTPFWRVLFGAVLISLSAPWVRLADTPPSVTGFYRMGIGAVLLFLWLLMVRRPIAVSPRAFALLSLPALAFAVDLWLWHRSIDIIGPGLATLLASFQVFIVAVSAWLIWREQLAGLYLLGAAVGLAGLSTMLGPQWAGLSGDFRIGIALGLGTAVAYAAYVLTLRIAQSGTASPPGPRLTLAWLSAICAVVLLIAALAEGASLAIPNAKTALSLLAYAICGQCLGWVLIASGIRELPAAIVGLLLLLQPALAFVWDVVFFSRGVAWFEALGLAIALVGIYVGSRGSNGR